MLTHKNQEQHSLLFSAFITQKNQIVQNLFKWKEEMQYNEQGIEATFLPRFTVVDS